MTKDADAIRATFTGYFTERGHTLVPGAGLIPHHRLAPMFTNAGMNQFLPYFVGEETPPFRRATSVQRCVRIRGKHDDVELIGRTTRHGSFFEMLGNFSFGDYFKAEAIVFAWDLLTNGFGLEPDRLWVTVHTDDDDVARLWVDEVGLPAERVQRMGADNFWEMADTGPCGPSSEIYYDRGERFGTAGGPAVGDEERYLEIWNLVFMQFHRSSGGALQPLPAPNIDTGAGLERLLTVLEGAESVWETSLMAPLVERAAEASGARYGADPEGDVALRVLADHARTMTFLISDGVFPSNEGRGYVLRRIIRRAVLRAQRFSPRELVLPPLVHGVIESMGSAYPGLERETELIETTVEHEEEAFRRTLRQGNALIEELLAGGADRIPGEAAFRLHDTFGFPIDLTVEVAADAGVEVDREGFEAEMTAERERARRAGRSAAGYDGASAAWREVLETSGPSRFVGYQTLEAEASVTAIVEREDEEFSSYEGEVAPAGARLLDVALDVTPFYAEGGGQIGDTGRLIGANGTLRVLDTTHAAEGLVRHTGYLESGTLLAGDFVTAIVDRERRAATRRNHTATHLLQSALRRVLGEHVKQQGSHVAPDRLRFDFSHFSTLGEEELAEVERLVNAAVLDNEPVEVHEMGRDEAERRGAIAFFGEKYGDVVRVVEAGSVSVELCGGTHVQATGMIGAFKITSESSIGANTRRIEATTGWGTLERFGHEEAMLHEAAGVLRTTVEELVESATRHAERLRELEEELRTVRAGQLREEARSLAAGASNGRVVARRDGLDPGDLRELALAIRSSDGISAVGVVGSPDGERVALVVASRPDAGVDARQVASEVARLVGGGGGGSGELATAGGRDVSGLDGALVRLGELLAVS